MTVRTKRSKLTPRERRKVAIRKNIHGNAERPRLCVSRSSKHISAQVINDDTGAVLASASTMEADVMKAVAGIKAEGLHSEAKSSKSVRAAMAVGAMIAKRALENKIDKVVFDRNGNLYHGRIKAVADGARESGLQF